MPAHAAHRPCRPCRNPLSRAVAGDRRVATYRYSEVRVVSNLAGGGQWGASVMANDLERHAPRFEALLAAMADETLCE